MRALSKTFLLLLATMGLASCGGGGGGSQGAFEPTPADSIAINASATSISTSSFTTLTITVTKHDGTVENDGATVNASVSPSTIGTVSGGAGSSGTTATNTLSGGKTTFNFNSSNQAGTASITISVPAGTNGATTVATATVPITVVAGNTQDPRLQLVATSTTLPLSPYSIGEQGSFPFPGNFIGSPFISEVSVTWRHSNGQLVGGTLKVNASSSLASVAGFSELDDGTTAWTGETKTPPTAEGNEFLTILGSGPVNVTAGVGTIFMHAGNIPGTTVLSVTAVDPDSNQAISSQLTFTVAGAATTLPASIATYSSGSVYVSSSGGPQSAIVSAIVEDGNNVPAPDPNGFDNVQFTIAGPASSDARLSGINAAGQQVTGTTITTVTHNGVASVSFQSGSQQGPVQVKATADRGDNNVDNGIQDAISSTTTVVVSDGKLYSLTLTSPDTNAILINRVSGNVTLVDQGGTGSIPPDPNATLSLTVSAIGTDRQGNPTLPGTAIKFGSIDAPQSNGAFSISGVQGDPQEGGNLFTAADGHFKTAGGGAGPGDTVIVFGKQVAGNSDLESASRISSVNSGTSLTVSTPFNRNDTTGTSVDYGPVLPYVIGRAQAGNISSPSFTDSVGVASTTLNYPISALGKAAAIWAQGNGTDNINNQTTIVTDAALTIFPGIEPAHIVISPNPVTGNLTIEVDACIFDALDSPLANVRFNFSFGGSVIGTLDGISSAGVVPDATDASGCVSTTVTTTGVAPGVAASLTFTAGVATATVPITVTTGLTLNARPSALGGQGGTVTLQLLTNTGTPVPGVLIVGTCSGDPSISITSGPGITDANGRTTAIIAANLDKPVTPASGSCTFTTSTGSPSAIVTLVGIDQCLASPAPKTCPNTTPTGSFNLALQLVSAGAGYGSVSSTPAGLPSCVMGSTTSKSCAAAFTSGTSVTLSANLLGPATSVTWSGDCGAAADNLNATVNMTANMNCTVTFKP